MFDYTDSDYEETDPLSMEPEVAAEWQYHDEVEYRTLLAISYPRDTAALEAAEWLTEQRAW